MFVQVSAEDMKVGHTVDVGNLAVVNFDPDPNAHSSIITVSTDNKRDHLIRKQILIEMMCYF